MSEKRFTLRNSNAISSNYPSQRVYDNKLKRELYNTEIVDLLNEQQTEIDDLKEENDKLHKKYHNLGQAIVKTCNDLGKTEEVYLADFNICKRITEYENELFDDEPFEFNKNCAKPYEIRSVSPNGVVRTGKKNSRVSWRMKDVREIYKELPPFEDFNRETLQEIRNKFHTKFDNDVIGRIIYNIYIGTFGEYI